MNSRQSAIFTENIMKERKLQRNISLGFCPLPYSQPTSDFSTTRKGFARTGESFQSSSTHGQGQSPLSRQLSAPSMLLDTGGSRAASSRSGGSSQRSSLALRIPTGPPAKPDYFQYRSQITCLF
eukprot:TRINITY_DN80045_c0_g1_i1.p1 TRINITY_DN80045_c0_g1~~TRINITY_DN80045_c0_g1_i1.p1  ORF type:complete len:124 (-),score=13.58 TRINITY_DN80045_c0_g1_i1:63-434(-)